MPLLRPGRKASKGGWVESELCLGSSFSPFPQEHPPLATSRSCDVLVHGPPLIVRDCLIERVTAFLSSFNEKRLISISFGSRPWFAIGRFRSDSLRKTTRLPFQEIVMRLSLHNPSTPEPPGRQPRQPHDAYRLISFNKR